MIKKNITNAIIMINHIFQVSIMLGLGYLQSLTNTRALVMRHLYQRNLDFKDHFLSEFGIMIQSIIIIIMVMSSALFLKKIIEKDNCYLKKVEVILFLILGIVMLGIINLDIFKDLLIYGYMIIGFYMILIIQSMNIRTITKERNE